MRIAFEMPPLMRLKMVDQKRLRNNFPKKIRSKITNTLAK